MKIAFYKSKKYLFNRLVSWWSRSEYTHVEIMLPTSDPAVFECLTSSYMDKGVRRVFMRPNPDVWDFVDIDADEEFARAWFAAHMGEGYDVLGLLGFVFRRGTQDQRKWFCSEAVAAALGYPEPWRFDPAGLFAAVSRKKYG